jgi:hypothetical protein
LMRLLFSRMTLVERTMVSANASHGSTPDSR